MHAERDASKQQERLRGDVRSLSCDAQRLTRMVVGQLATMLRTSANTASLQADSQAGKHSTEVVLVTATRHPAAAAMCWDALEASQRCCRPLAVSHGVVQLEIGLRQFRDGPGDRRADGRCQ